MRATYQRLGIVVSLFLAGCPSGETAGNDAGRIGIDANLPDAPPLCPTMGAENTLAACSDGCDNDEDFTADCDDRGCCGQNPACDSSPICTRDAGQMLDAARPDAFLVTCPTTGPEDTDAACRDGCDNDGNRFVDCGDRECCSARTDCGTTEPDSYCGRMQNCPGAGREVDPTLCANGMDDDCNGFTDCEDRNCCPHATACSPTSYCGRTDAGPPFDAGPRPDAFVLPCATMGPEDSDSACRDGCDNDGNRFVDCGDRECCSARTDCGTTEPNSYCGRMQNCPGGGREDDPTLCANGMDDDCNGYVDCEDRNCCGLVTCGAGTYCARFDAGAPVDAGPRPDAFVLACPTMSAESSVDACNDGCDNDNNRFVDCGDRECCTVRTDCGTTAPNSYCGRLQSCPGGGMENTAALCGNGMDDDCDGYPDCEDRDCCSRVSCVGSTYCGRLDAGVPSGDGGVRADAFVVQCATMGAENTPAACADGCNNDSDPFVDCNDFDCCGVVVCAPGTSCGNLDGGLPSDAGPRPDAFVVQCATMGPENTPAACMDACSNDGDRFVDCEDSDCCSVRSDCAMGTYCGRGDGGTNPGGAENTAATCTDGVSNDSNMFADCNERSCCLVRERLAMSDPGMACGASTFCGCRGQDAGRACFNPTPGAMLCTGDDVNQPPSPENDAQACGNGCDDDRDGFVDCADTNCSGSCPVP